MREPDILCALLLSGTVLGGDTARGIGLLAAVASSGFAAVAVGLGAAQSKSPPPSPTPVPATAIPSTATSVPAATATLAPPTVAPTFAPTIAATTPLIVFAGDSLTYGKDVQRIETYAQQLIGVARCHEQLAVQRRESCAAHVGRC